ncbi:MAG: YbdK family carboxylate-amine ligase [Acidimicrobiales bacterium]|nr:YbdK family carboxylate-amine ligase [Acidimicrobiales bacterium]
MAVVGKCWEMQVMRRDPGGRTSPQETEAIRAVFDANEPGTVGVEEEILLLDPRSLQPLPIAAEIVAAIDDEQVKPELPACQLELVTRPHRAVADVVAELGAARSRLAEACGDQAVPAAAAVHPHVHGPVAVSSTGRSQAMDAQYGQVAHRQLVGSLQVHVAVGSADATLAVYNALRGHLPELAALAAAAPFHDGRDTGLSSIRPLICTQLPRQGVPPELATWEAFADDLAWGAATGWVPEPGRWWWELRPHVVHGTLEVRVPDVQPTIEAAGAVTSVVQALVADLAARHLGGEDLGCPPSWRIAENRWSALRDGPHGEVADLITGEKEPTAIRLHRMLDRIEPFAPAGLDEARSLIAQNTADRLRDAGLDHAVRWLVEVFMP